MGMDAVACWRIIRCVRQVRWISCHGIGTKVASPRRISTRYRWEHTPMLAQRRVKVWHSFVCISSHSLCLTAQLNQALPFCIVLSEEKAQALVVNMESETIALDRTLTDKTLGHQGERKRGIKAEENDWKQMCHGKIVNKNTHLWQYGTSSHSLCIDCRRLSGASVGNTVCAFCLCLRVRTHHLELAMC